MCIADEVPFDIPESWEWVRISGVFSVINGDRGKNYPAKSTLSNTGIPFISAVNLDGKTVIEDDNLLCLSDEQFNKLGSGKLEKDDVVVCIRGSLGKHGRYPFEKGAIASSLVILRPHLNIPLLSDFIMMYLDSPLFFSEIKRYNNGTAQPNLAAKSLEMFFLPLPPLPEQKRIVEKLNEVSSLTDNYAEAYVRVAELNQKFPELLKKSILQEAVQGKLVSQDPNDEPASVLLERIRAEKQALIKAGKIKKGKHESVIFRRDNSHYEKLNGIERCIDDEIPFEIPNNWCWVRLGSLFQHNTGKALNSSNKIGTKLTYITTSNLYWDKFVLDRLKEMPFTDAEVEKCTVIKGDLLVCEGGDIGRAAIWNYDFPMRIQNHIHRLRSYIPVNVKFYYYIFYLYKHMGLIGGKGIGIQGLSSKVLHQLLFPFPPLQEQYRIVEMIDKVLSYCEKI